MTELYYSLTLNFIKKNLTFIINILIKNDYLLKFIFDTINDRIKNIQHGGTIEHDRIREILSDRTNTNEESKSIISWFTVSFIPFIIKKFNKFNRDNIKVPYYSSNKLNSLSRYKRILDQTFQRIMSYTRSYITIAEAAWYCIRLLLVLMK